MIVILAVFRTRTQTMGYASRLQSAGVPCALVNTPKEANVGCGLSVQFPCSCMQTARSVLGKGGYSAFGGFYRKVESHGRISVARI